MRIASLLLFVLCLAACLLAPIQPNTMDASRFERIVQRYREQLSYSTLKPEEKEAVAAILRQAEACVEADMKFYDRTTDILFGAVVISGLGHLMTWLSLGKRRPNQPIQRNASTGSVSNFESPARRG